MPNKIEVGLFGQQKAEQFLIEKGCKILKRNFRTPVGEIDLIVQDGTYIVFVEVKFRRSLQYGQPREAVNGHKQRHIKKAALFYIARHQLAEQDFRFDVIEVLQTDRQINLSHIENAFS